MNNQERAELIYEKEYAMWKAAIHREVKAFKELVAEEAIMICDRET